MKNILIFTILLFTLSLVVSGQIISDERSDVEQQVLQTDAELFDAIWQADVEKRREIVADSLVYITYYGSVLNKTEWIAQVTKPANEKSKYIRDNLKVQIFDNTAIVTGRLTMKQVLPQSIGKIQSRFTNVYVRQNKNWKLVSGQITEVAKQFRDFQNIDNEKSLSSPKSKH